MEKKLNEDEDFWDFKSNQVKGPPFQAKSKKDEFNLNNSKEEINNNNQEEKRQQSKDHIDADDKGIGDAEDRSFRIEKLIKSLDKLKPAHRDRDEMSESQRSNDDRHFDSLTDENKINSKNGITYATTDSGGSGSDGETHGANSRDKKGKRNLKLDDGKSKDNNTDRSGDGFGHHKEDEEFVPAHSSGTHRSNDPDEAESKTLDGYDTFVDYGFLDEGTQLKRDSPVDGLILNDDSEEKTFKVHPPKSGDPRRSRRQTRKPNVDAKTSKSSHQGVNGQDFDNQRQAKDDDDDDQGESCDEIQNQRLSQEAESSGKENAGTPKSTQIRKSRNRKVNEKRGSTHEDSGKDGTGGETEDSRSPPRLRKGLRSGDYDWSQSGNEEMREWVKQKNRIARKQRAEDKRKERIRKQEEAEGKVTGLVGDQERKSVESLERKKKQKPKQRSSSCPGDGGAGDRKVLPRSRSQPRMSKVLRSGDFDWSTSKNDEIRVWLKKKKRLIRKKRAEERKKEKMKKKEEEQKRREHEEMYADSSERVSEWMKLKRRQEYLQKKKRVEEQAKAGQENEKVMVIGRRMNYESPTEKQAPEKHEEPTLKTDQKQEDLRKSEQPLLKQREKQRQLLLSTGPKQPINQNKTLNSSRFPKENERKDLVSKRPANQTQQVVNTVEEITLPNTETITSLPSTERRSSGVKTPNRRVNEAVVLPKQSLSTPKVNIPTGNVRVGTEPENVKKKITFDEWLKNKKTDDERKRVSDQAAKEQGKNLGELNKSVEILKLNLAPEKRSVPTGSAENLSKRAIRPKSAVRQQKQPQVKQEQETVTSQRQDSPENKRSQAAGATIDDVSDMRQLMAETSENSPRSSRSSSKKGTRSNESDKMAASELATNKVSDHPHKVRGGNIPATALRAKSPKPKVAVRPTLRSVNYQQGSWEKFSDYMWDEVNENEGGELTTNRDKPTRAEAEITEANFERKTEKPEGKSRRDEKVEASAGFRGDSEFRLDMDSELTGSENIISEISRMPHSRNDDIHTIIDAEEEETETELDDGTKAESRREIQVESKSLGHGQSRGAVDKVRGIALPPRSSPGHRVHFSGSEEEIMSDLEILG